MNNTHPVKAAGGTDGEIRAFERIASNHPPQCHDRILNRLMHRGLVAAEESCFDYGKMDYYIPMEIRSQWEQWKEQKEEAA